ncbi:hypothetical protein NKR23_g958 [Pleurostoma richardsiae]|uniref:DUF952 domain-containing protein n=1 Tax=Pleurostoma richardsiae TaxID=41990 RepID=A0AA38SDM5_9PEZI|nr:hypothetical protein NKR23_g958 [Pleurostoma richardsiae]
MVAPKVIPRYVYKIVEEAPAEPFPETFTPSELDKKDGFIHLSTSWQVPITADLFFKDFSRFWVVKVRLERFAASTNWDDAPDTDGCPHLYGSFGREDVDSVKGFERNDGETWAQVLKGNAWLE